jgi:peptidyl-prolyl cis-trans isomerase A (cyclophilin A)
MKRTLSLIVSTTIMTVCALSPMALAQESKPAADAPKAIEPAKPTDKPADQKAAEPKPANPAAPGEQKDAIMEKFVYVKVATNQGDFYMELNNEKAPISVKNFLDYVDQKFYDGTIFHRVIGNFMIQGGGFTEGMKEKTAGKPIKNEWSNGLKNIRGAVSMARTQVADSATSQFFVNVVDNPFLDQPRDGAGYAVFARVVSGMDVLDKIKNVKTGAKGGHQNVPLTDVKITSITRTTAAEAMKGEATGEKR